MAQSILSEYRRSRVAQFIAAQIFVRQLLNGAYALVPDIFEVIEAFFKFTAALLLRRLSECL